MCSEKHNTLITAPAFGLRGVGKQIAKQLARLNIYSIQDLLLHLPVRYQDRTQIQPIHNLIPDKEAVIEGVITDVITPVRGRTKLLCTLADETGVIYLRFFHILSFQSQIFKQGTRLRCYSDVRLSPKGLELIHPEFQVISPDKPIVVDTHLTPIYPATAGLSQHMLRKLITNALAWLTNNKAQLEVLPVSLLQSLALPTLEAALEFVHKPPQNTLLSQLYANKTSAQQRLVLEELLAHRISLLKLKLALRSQQGVVLFNQMNYTQQFLARLPFKLTSAQARVAEEIRQDLMQSRPMLRLLQGDVGSGKTVIAALAMLQTVENGQQAAIMAPTELLAEQHFRVMQQWLAPLQIKVVFLAGNVKASVRHSTLRSIEQGEAQIIIGTHALFQEKVIFHQLALVVIDEQQRFGVHQRALFREKGEKAHYYPHQLVMTATPIPRTLAMSFYADLDCSVIDELPPGRVPIVTSVIASSRRDAVMARVREACQQGRQVYWVCPLIEESEVISAQAATKLAAQLQQALPELKIDLIHGRMRAQDKESVMWCFQQGQVQVLVATTVIEVGVDVANASVMIIENAERLGLSQLHQLRGRVGRGAIASHCLLLYQQPLSELAKERLAVMRATTDGFRIAQRDLELRGPGEVLGTKQTGELAFHVADLLRDSDILPIVLQTADLMIREHSDLVGPLLNRWLGELTVIYPT